MPEPSSVCWHPCHRAMAGVVNNPLHFRGELSALKGCEWKNIKGKHSPSIQESGPRQGAGHMPCPAWHTPARATLARCARELWHGCQMAESGMGTARRGRADGPLPSEAMEARDAWVRHLPRAASRRQPCPWPGLQGAQILLEEKNWYQIRRRNRKVNLEALEGWLRQGGQICKAVGAAGVAGMFSA